MSRGVSILAHKALKAVLRTSQSVEVQLHHLRSHSAKAPGLSLACLPACRHCKALDHCRCVVVALNSHGSMWNR